MYLIELRGQQVAHPTLALGVPAFACTPDKFPDLMAAALNKQDLSLWVSENCEEIGFTQPEKTFRLLEINVLRIAISLCGLFSFKFNDF